MGMTKGKIIRFFQKKISFQNFIFLFYGKRLALKQVFNKYKIKRFLMIHILKFLL